MNRVLGEGVTGLGLDVGLLCQGWWPQAGGVESHSRALAQGLAARGHRVHVLCCERDGTLAPYAVADELREGVSVRRMGAPTELRAFADLVADPRASDVVLAWLAEVPCDVIHAQHLSGLGASALRAVAEMGRPLVLSLHDHWLLCPCGQLRHDAADPSAALACARRHWPHLLPSGGGEARGPDGEALADDAQTLAARTAFARAMLALPQRVVAPAAGVIAAHAGLGLESARAHVIEHGLDARGLRAEVDALRHSRPREPGRVRLGVLGAVLPSKGVVELLEALREVESRELELEVHGPLVAFHGDGSHLEDLRRLAAADGRVRLCGAYRPEDLPRILAGLDGVAAPAVWDEVFGLSVREARAAGLGVLVSDRGGLPAAAQGGAAGEVLPAGDRAAWAAALRRFASDGPRREAWQARPHELRDLAAMTLDYERLYAELTLSVTGRLPELPHALPDLEAHAPRAERRAPPAAPRGSAAGLWRRLFGRR